MSLTPSKPWVWGKREGVTVDGIYQGDSGVTILEQTDASIPSLTSEDQH